MAVNKKFLDAKGIQVLWSQIALNDYPNNETLMAVINAIDSAKQDKVTGQFGDFVVVGADGNLTTKTIALAEDVSF